ncbi:hypothetical protein HY416_03420 [Candidatus Kaiserbacteria bacterium]|nr:hypothetical protein [Candidatus Kaiserbacteria bacterium]
MAKQTPSQKKRLVLLDAHAILHRAYHALPDFAAPNGEPTGALYGLVAMLFKIIEELKPDYIVACFDLAGPTYRHDAYEKYKATRVKTEDSLVTQINRSRDIFAAFGIRIYDHAGFEADDMLGTIVEQTKKMKDLDIVIASGDMDTLQLIIKKKVQVYTLRKGIKDTIMYDEAMVKERFGFGPEHIADYKGLRGDPSDNIPGIVGIGEKTATELVTRFGSIEAIYKKLAKSEKPFLEAGISPRIIALLKENEEEAQFSKMLATIRRDAPIAFVLPEETWRVQLDVPRVLDLFSEFGFRTLGSRVRQLFGGAADSPDGESAAPERPEEIPDDVLRKTAVALWLLRSDITNPTADDIIEYGRSNAKTQSFAEASEYIFKELNASGVYKLYREVELPLIAILRKMEVVGIRLDRAYLGELSKELHTELSGIESRIYKFAGMEFNLNSPKQLGEVLYDTLGLAPKNQKRTGTGQRSTRESELEKLRDAHPVIKDILRYRELAKLLGTYIDNLPAMVGQDERLHTTFLQAGSVTGRMATQNPGLQNIPIRSEDGFKIRRAFVAERGYRLVAIDYSQIELRIAAILSGDPKMIEIFKNGEDVHSAVASRVFGVPEKDVDREMRRRAKVINFGILYGMGVNALRQNLGEETPRAEAQEFLTAYFHTFTTLAQYLEDVKSAARKLGYTETFFGRRRYFEGIRSSLPFIRASAERMALNAPIQGTAADVIRIAMVRVDKYLTEAKLEDDVRMILQVHDELIFEVKQSRVAEVAPKLKEIMEQAFPERDAKGVPLVAEAKVGTNWGTLEKL